MSNLQHLLKHYADHPAVQDILQCLENQSDKTRIQLAGLTGAQESFAIAATINGQKPTTASTHLLIANSKEEAAYRHNDLEGIMGKDRVFFFPDSFKRPAYFEDLNQTQILQRSETISTAPPSPPEGGALRSVEPLGPVGGETASQSNQASSSEHHSPPSGLGGAIITYPEALFEKVVKPEILQKSRIEVNTGERLNVDFMIEVLVEYGFIRADFVYEPGQFSIRGGIIDLFSFGNEMPYRIELFDDEVETLRTFDPTSQLSLKNLNKLSIVPNLNTRFRHDEKVSLLNILPANTVIWVKDIQFLVDRLQYCFDRAELFASKVSALDSVELRELFRDRAFLFPAAVLEDLANHPIIFLEGKMDILKKTFPGLF